MEVDRVYGFQTLRIPFCESLEKGLQEMEIPCSGPLLYGHSGIINSFRLVPLGLYPDPFTRTLGNDIRAF